MEHNTSSSDRSVGIDVVQSADMEQLSKVVKYLVANYNTLNKLQKLTTINLVMRMGFTGNLDRVVIPPMAAKDQVKC